MARNLGLFQACKLAAGANLAKVAKRSAKFYSLFRLNFSLLNFVKTLHLKDIKFALASSFDFNKKAITQCWHTKNSRKFHLNSSDKIAKFELKFTLKNQASLAKITDFTSHIKSCYEIDIYALLTKFKTAGFIKSAKTMWRLAVTKCDLSPNKHTYNFEKYAPIRHWTRAGEKCV